MPTVDLQLDDLFDGRGERCFELGFGSGESRTELLESLRAWQHPGM